MAVSTENCRFYEDPFPKEGDLVMVRVFNICQVSAYASLLEYYPAEGMIPFTELSRRRIRSLNKHLRVGKLEIVQVLTVDSEKGYIDLSKRKVTPADMRICEERYNKAKAVHTILRVVYSQFKSELSSLEELYSRIAWPLARVYGSSYDGFKAGLLHPEKAFGTDVIPADKQLPAHIMEALRVQCSERLKAHPYRIRCVIEVTCFTAEGVEAIKVGLLAAEAIGTPDIPIKIRLERPPQFTVTTVTTDKEGGIAKLNDAIEEARTVMTAKNGSVKLAQPPVVVSDEEHRKKADDEDSEEEEEEEEEDEDNEEDEDVENDDDNE